jgi:copper chaperone CopZ
MKNKFILSLTLMLFALFTQAQVKKVIIQASGLTCSMCSNSINKALKSIDYVEIVTPNIKNSTFEIAFKTASNVNYDQLKKKVEDAGFFVSKFEVILMANKESVSNDAHVDIDGTMYHFLNVSNQEIDGETKFKILDKGFVSAKEYKKNSKLTQMECYQTGYMGACCKNKSKQGGTRIYHVTI